MTSEMQDVLQEQVPNVQMRVVTEPIIEKIEKIVDTICNSRVRWWMCSRVATTDAYVSKVQKTEVQARCRKGKCV